MKACDLIELLKGTTQLSKTCDTIKFGDERKEIFKVAVCMVPTIDVIRSAKEWGADMVIFHEPLYYNHWDVPMSDIVTQVKRSVVESSEMVFFRYHDYMHSSLIDEIIEGELTSLGLSGNLKDGAVFVLDQPLTALTLAKLIEDRLNISHVRIAGELNKEATKIALRFGDGMSSGMIDVINDDDVEIVLTGETVEWMVSEYVRDAKSIGRNKSLIVMGHIGSERDGMKVLTEKLKKKVPSVTFRYLECGEVYFYTDKIN